MLCGLNYLHTNGIVHRDLKPDNILLFLQQDNDDEKKKTTTTRAPNNRSGGKTMRLALSDFGLAEFARADHPTLMVSGTPGYIAPETWCASTKYTSAVDMWAAGFVLLDICFGPFSFGSAPRELGLTIADAKDLAILSSTLQQPFDAEWIARHSLGERCKAIPLSAATNLARNGGIEGKEKRAPATQWLEKKLEGKGLNIPSPTRANIIQLIVACLSIAPERRPTAQQAMRSAAFDALRTAGRATCVEDRKIPNFEFLVDPALSMEQRMEAYRSGPGHSEAFAGLRHAEADAGLDLVAIYRKLDALDAYTLGAEIERRFRLTRHLRDGICDCDSNASSYEWASVAIGEEVVGTIAISTILLNSRLKDANTPQKEKERIAHTLKMLPLLQLQVSKTLGFNFTGPFTLH
jgi:serine/threonine protein kinase